MKYLAILAILMLTATNALASPEEKCHGPKVADYTEFYNKAEGGRHVTVTGKEEIQQLFNAIISRLGVDDYLRPHEIQIDLYFWNKNRTVTYITSAANGKICSQRKLSIKTIKGVIGEDI